MFNLRDTKAEGEAISSRKYRFYFRFSDRVIVLSNEMKRFYERFTKSPDKVVFIYSAVDFSRFFPAKPEEKTKLRLKLGIDTCHLAVGFVAVFSDKKNQLGLIDNTARKWRKHLPDIKLYFVGDFDVKAKVYDKKCYEACEKAEVFDHFNFVGFAKDIENYYRALDLIVVPTRKEGLARCMIESLACGTPVVSFDVSSAHEILTANGLGSVVKQGDYSALIESIAQQLTKSRQESQCFSVHCHRIARQLFDPRYIVDQYKNLYIEVLER